MAFLNGARAVVVAAIVTASAAVCAALAVAQEPLEDEVKAVFLFNFAKYVDWPATPQGSSATLRICVPANPAFLALVREAVRDEVVNGRPLQAIGLEGLDGARECDILFVGDTSTGDAAAWAGAVRGRHTLTVGDGRLTDGVVIAFVRDQDRLRFDINRAAAGRQSLKISSRLLGLARRVDP
jgi:YfiR/HmsC-like